MHSAASYLGGPGERHAGYSATAPHYDLVGAVLLETMAEMAGPAWTDELNDAWSGASAAINGIMLAAADGAAERAA